MGKRLLVQRAGRGTSVFKSPSHLRIGTAKYPQLDPAISLKGRVIELIHDPGRWVPLAKIVLENGVEFLAPAVEGMYVGQIVQLGPQASISNGNILPVGSIPEGTQVANVELRPGDGGRLVRSSGAYALVVGRAGGKTIIRLPSGRAKEVLNSCRAMIGVIAGGGRIEKPLLKAGASYYKWRVKARKWPRVRGVAMNAVSHPHGGGGHQSVSFPSTVSRNAPPGAKVGHIAARRAGRRKG
ncbi:MAG: 50S ribosomal protein L2 [Desulfurococcaceae archaeon]